MTHSRRQKYLFFHFFHDFERNMNETSRSLSEESASESSEDEYEVEELPRLKYKRLQNAIQGIL